MLYWIWLTQIRGLGPIRQRMLLDKFNSPKNIHKATISELSKCKGIGSKIAERIVSNKALEKAKKILERTKKERIKILTLDNLLYPVKAKKIKKMPIILYYKGNIVKNSMGVGIVGSRRCSEYGKQVTNDVASYLAKQNICVISGMAKGIDGYSHTACIKAGGYTIAVLGNGLDICYPSEHKELMERIIEKGAVISEYPPGIKPDPKHFPRRNLIISAWSYKILVIEAGIKSGSLITANYGIKYNREVFALPDNIYRRESLGSNSLIYNGAKIYLEEKQLLIDNRYEDLKKSDGTNNIIKKNTSLNKLDDIEKRIIKLLSSKDSVTIDELNDYMRIDKMKLIEKISLMELEDKIIINGSLVKLV